MDNMQCDNARCGFDMSDKEIAIQAVLDSMPNKIIGTTYIQTTFGIGYSRSVGILYRLEDIGVINYNNNNPAGMEYDIVVGEEDLLEKFENRY